MHSLQKYWHFVFGWYIGNQVENRGLKERDFTNYEKRE